MDYIEVSAVTIEDAIKQGNETLAKNGHRATETKVLEEPSKGFLGFGKKPALVRIYFETIDATGHVLSSMEEAEAIEADGTLTVQATATAAEVIEEPTDAHSPLKTDSEGVEKTITPEQAAVSETAEVAPGAPKEPKVSKENQEAIAKAGKAFLMDMFMNMGLSVQIEKMSQQGKIIFQVHGEDLGILIGKHGQTLDAIQYLTNLVANKEVNGRCQIVVDVENYRSRREETLVKLAHRLGSKVRKDRKKVALEPMNAFERKVIHLALQDEPHIKTDSEGTEPYRHVVISYKK